MALADWCRFPFAPARALIESLPARIDGCVFSLAPHSVSQYFLRTCREAKVDDLHFHDMPHEGTSRLFEKRLSIMEVASITGHKTMSMLKRYTHLCPDALADKLGSLALDSFGGVWRFGPAWLEYGVLPHTPAKICARS